MVLENLAVSGGGGAYGGMLQSCAVTGNSAKGGGGASSSTLKNCTVTGNSALTNGGGVWTSTLTNCVVYYNTARMEENYSQSVLSYCCTAPLPTKGLHNLTDEPALASASHLSPASPCRGAGDASSTGGLDIDGDAWLRPPSIGCDEYRAGSAAGPLTVAATALWTNVSVGFATDLTGLIEGVAASSVWDFGDGAVLSNRPFASHAWTQPGDYGVVLRAYNESNPGGVSATVTVRVVARSVHYVAVDSSSPALPYASWATAARSIQEAVDAVALPGSLILVSNGIYAAGGRVMHGPMTNRVVIDKPVEVRSVNGPEVTVIQGYQVPGVTNGDSSVRCVYLTNGAVLSGFTLCGGAAGLGNRREDYAGGGMWCESMRAVATNCIITGNAAGLAGGVYLGTLNSCTLARNQGYFAAGAYGSSLNHCVLTSNSASFQGGGVHSGNLFQCILTGNTASSGGGGVHSSTLTGCTLTGNAAYGGGGASGSTLNNCAVAGNSASAHGGGSAQSTLNNCTITGNWASFEGGGAYRSALNNCIVYYNDAPAGRNSIESTLNYCCTAPEPVGGTGNITNEPGLASASHLSAGSPCRGGGSAGFASGVDIDGEHWLSPPSMGCDEYRPGSASGPLRVAVSAVWTNVAVGFALELSGLTEGRLEASVWDFGDGTVLTNCLRTSHPWLVPGNYEVVLRAFNDSNPSGVSATAVVQVVARPVSYVAADSSSPSAPYASWETAAQTIQEAVDAVSLPGSLVLVSNGVYASGSRRVSGLTNRVVIDKPVEVRSLKGPESAIIQGERPCCGGKGVRCVYLTNGAILSGFTLTNGSALGSVFAPGEARGGGLWCNSINALATNCVLAGHQAAEAGGAACGGTLDHCTISGNQAGTRGGGAYGGVLNSCTLLGNHAPISAGNGGAVDNCSLYNCILASNSATCGGAASSSTLYNCTVVTNSATYGGAAYGGTLYECTLATNFADCGGGAYQSTLHRCTLSGNSATFSGGGAYDGSLSYCALLGNAAVDSGGGARAGSLNNCSFTGNSARYGGGADEGTLSDCVLVGNSAESGGGAFGGWLNNCMLLANTASWSGGGTTAGTLNHCTVAGNSAIRSGGGSDGGSLTNCIVYYNTAPNGHNFYGSEFSFSCTTPLPEGEGNIESEPLFVDLAGGNLRLRADSRCINAGKNNYVAAAIDLDGNPRIIGDIVDMGAYEFQLNASSKPVLACLPPGANGAFQMRVSGIQRPGVFVLEMSTNLTTWQPVLTNTTAATTLDYADETAKNLPCRFYRGVQR